MINTKFLFIKKLAIGLIVIAGFFNPITSSANDHVIAVDYIRGEGDVEGIKLAYQYHTDYLTSVSPLLGLYFESSINFWEYGTENIHDTNFVLAASPVIRYEFTQWYGNPLHAEFGIGVSLLDDTKFAGKDVSTHYQFEDRLGVVYKFAKAHKNSVALRYFHYSNAGFKSPNPGLDFLSVSYSVKI